MIYAIGDIHGQLKQLDRALSLIETDGGSNAEIVFLGDYIDRGQDSRGVLAYLINLKEAAKNLYKTLRIIKKNKFKSIAVEKISNIGFGEAINDRLIRASKL